MADQFSMLGMGNAQYLTPEMAQRLANVSYAPQESAGLEKQLDQALALRGQQMPHRESANAALYDGIGGLVRNLDSHQQERRIRGQQAGLLGQQKGEYGEFLKQLFQAQQLRNQPQPVPPPDDGMPQL